MTHIGVGVVEAIRVGYNLQEDVHPVEDGSESGVFPIISHNLREDTTFKAADLWAEVVETAKKKQQIETVPAHLLSNPGATGLRDPFSGMDPSVDPDGRTVASTGAELRQRKGKGVNIICNK